MPFTRPERAALTQAIEKLREQAGVALEGEFAGQFMDQTDAAKKAQLLPVVTAMRAAAQAHLTALQSGVPPAQTAMQAQIAMLDGLIAKLQ